MMTKKGFMTWLAAVALMVLTLVFAGCGGGGGAQIALPQLPQPPATPTGVVATAGDGQVTVNWNTVAGATSYKIYYGTAAGVTSTSASTTKLTATTNSQVVTGLTNGTTYYFVVSALNAGGESAVSSEVLATPVPPAPVKPTGVIVSGGDGQATISWTGVSGATSYNVYYATASGQETSGTGVKISGAVSPQTITGLTNGTTYYFVVTSQNAGGESGVSSEKTVTPAAAPQPPGTPTGVVVTSPAVGQVHIVWNAVSGADSYNVYYLASATTPTNADVLAGTVVSSATASLDLSLTSQTKYYFLVKAVNSAGLSGTQTSAKYVTVQ
jgi:fibronectin type 3 domain-containing protein